jgi:hypothetical protein
MEFVHDTWKCKKCIKVKKKENYSFFRVLEILNTPVDSKTRMIKTDRYTER